MHRLNMSLQITLWRSLMITMITRIFDFLMHRPIMSLQTSLCCSLMVALITRIFDFLMYRLNMLLQTSLFRKLMTAQITRIFDFLMDRLNWNKISRSGRQVFVSRRGHGSEDVRDHQVLGQRRRQSSLLPGMSEPHQRENVTTFYLQDKDKRDNCCRLLQAQGVTIDSSR